VVESLGVLPGEPDWREAVGAAEGEELARVLGARLRPSGSPRSVSVTDLLAPRRAYWRAVGPPVPVPFEREQRLEGGRRLHRALGLVFSPRGALEVRVRREGLHGRVDVLEDRPIEVKTTGSPLPSDDLRRSRPDHVDQLGMYCALLDRPLGRLIYVRLGPEGAEAVAAYDLEFDALEAVRSEMARRADSFRRALSSGQPTELPRCAWFGRGCEYRAAGACDCVGTEPEPGPLAADRAGVPASRPDLAAPLAAAIASVPSPTVPPVIQRFRDLLYPRREFFRRMLPEAPAAAAPSPPGEVSDLYRRLTDAVEAGAVGEVCRLPTRSEEPDEEVGGLFGAPYLVRTSRLRRRVPASDWLTRSPQYALELGLRCVATGTHTARLVLGYEQAGAGAERVQVVEMTFDPSSVFSRVWRGRAETLARALEAEDPGRLPPCPRWMYGTCDYRSVCGCGALEGRVQWKRTVDAVRVNPSDS